jgi:hypothetical protein
MDEMTLVRPRREILGGIALGVAVAATAMGVYNRVQIEQLKAELFEVKENTSRLFEVIQDFGQNMAALETGFNEIWTTLLYQVMFNLTLFDSRLSHLENQLRGRLRQVTNAIQAAMHQRFAIDYLNPAGQPLPTIIQASRRSRVRVTCSVSFRSVSSGNIATLRRSGRAYPHPRAHGHQANIT